MPLIPHAQAKKAVYLIAKVRNLFAEMEVLASQNGHALLKHMGLNQQKNNHRTTLTYS
jgi:hypothetical protein